MPDREAQGESLDEVLRAAAAGVIERAKAGELALKARVADLEAEVRFLRGGTKERRYELRFARQDRIPAGDGHVTSSVIEAGGITHVVAVRRPDSDADALEALRAALPDGVVVVAMPPGTELSVLELVPEPGDG